MDKLWSFFAPLKPEQEQLPLVQIPLPVVRAQERIAAVAQERTVLQAVIDAKRELELVDRIVERLMKDIPSKDLNLCLVLAFRAIDRLKIPD